MQRPNYCPNCGNELSKNPVDIGVGEIYEPMSCECCGWAEPTCDEIVKAISDASNPKGDT